MHPNCSLYSEVHYIDSTYLTEYSSGKDWACDEHKYPWLQCLHCKIISCNHLTIIINFKMFRHCWSFQTFLCMGELENLPVDQSPTNTLHYYCHIWCPHCIHINSQKQRVITCTYLPRQVLGYQQCFLTSCWFFPSEYQGRASPPFHTPGLGRLPSDQHQAGHHQDHHIRSQWETVPEHWKQTNSIIACSGLQTHFSWASVCSMQSCSSQLCSFVFLPFHSFHPPSPMATVIIIFT